MSIVDWFYPKRCVGCGGEGKYICEKCRRGIVRVGDSLRYAGVVRKVIKEIKYRGTYDMVAELVEIWEPLFLDEYKGAVITAVPMWKDKKRVRGYNQAELIAKELAKRWKLSYAELLVRTRETKPMYGLSRAERARNIAGAFALNKAINKSINAKIILVDDVWTTGATMRECMTVLRRGGAKQIWGVTLAR